MYYYRFKNSNTMYPWGEWMKTLFLGLGTNVFDVYSDVGTGIYYTETKTVIRGIEVNSTVPENCVAHANTSSMECQETDPLWAAITLVGIQFPGLLIGSGAAAGALFFRLTKDEKYYAGYKKVLLGGFFLMIIPFPLVVFAQQVASMFIRSDQMSFLSIVLLFAECSLEASCQLLLLLYILLSDAERDIDDIQKLSILSSIFVISKTSVELFLGESFDGRTTPTAVRKHTESLNDSMTKGKPLSEVLLLMIKFLPAFVTSFVFKVGSLAIIFSMLEKYAVVYLVFGILIAFCIAYKTHDTGINMDKKFGFAAFYALTNIMILAKIPLENRQLNSRPMLNVSMMWYLLHFTTLVGLMLWVGALPASTHLAHWSSQRFALREPSIFYPATCLLILIVGPLSIFCMRCLRTQVLSFEKMEKERKEKENEENDKCCLCFPLCSGKPGVEYEDGVRLFWNATREDNCKVKDRDDEECDAVADADAVAKKVEYKVDEKDGQEEGVSLLPILSA